MSTPVPDDQPQPKPGCEHFWAHHCYGGLSVRLCQLCHEPDWGDVRGQREQVRREALMALAAEIEALNGWPKLEGITEETHQYARGVIQGIADMARRQAQDQEGGPSGSPGLSQDTRGDDERRGDLRAAGEITAEVVAAALRADHEEGIRDGRSYHQVPDHQVRRLIAGAVAAERERIAQLAEEREAQYLIDRGDHADFRAFADLIREGGQ